MTPRQRAKEAEQKFYRTGKPCLHDHNSKRRTSTAKCIACEEAGRVKRRILQHYWYKNNAISHNAKSRDRHRALREETIKAYGERCKCCGEMALEFLCLDHKNGGGNQHRKTEPVGVLFRRLKREGYPKEDYQVLCCSCNHSLGVYGYCPHQRLRYKKLGFHHASS